MEVRRLAPLGQEVALGRLLPSGAKCSLLFKGVSLRLQPCGLTSACEWFVWVLVLFKASKNFSNLCSSGGLMNGEGQPKKDGVA